MPSARAVTINGAGGVDVLSLGTLEVREPGPHEVLVEVAAAGLNRADTLQRRGFYPAPTGAPANVPGLEYAGIVGAVGEGVSMWSAGDRVMAIAGGGGMATHIVAHERELIEVPEKLTLEQAAAVPEVFLTAYDAMFVQAGLAMGETVLIHSIGSGIGTAALQLALAGGAHPIGTTRTAAKLERCIELGLTNGIVVDDKTFRSRVEELTGGDMADVILDTVGAAYLDENIGSLATRGRMVIIGLMGGVSGTAPLGKLLAKRATVIGSVLRARPLEEKAALAREFAARIVPLFEREALVPVIDTVMPMGDVAAAHERMEANESFGKIVLRWD
jgi:putative PIG3 family NAD(P)H quinone oxidoreductase